MYIFSKPGVLTHNLEKPWALSVFKFYKDN